MSIHSNFSQITMELYETDMQTLKKFIANAKGEGAFTEEYLILYDFAVDCKYSKSIQPELIRYLLPFYLKTMEQAVRYKNKIAMDIYVEFNLAMFLNQENMRNAIGEKDYQYVMDTYIKQTMRKMEDVDIPKWVSLFNTTIALGNDNIHQLFKWIFEGSLKIKYSFFQYISILLWKESDNLFVRNEAEAFWTSNIWDFDDSKFFWSDDIVGFFDKEIYKERIESLFEEIRPMVFATFGGEMTDFFKEEIHQSVLTGVFDNRKAEFLKKINCKSEKDRYWDTTF